jgi:hypothetical protein
MVRWTPATVEHPNAGSNQLYVHDPRSGEILAASIQAYHNVETFGPSWYLVQAGAVDTRAQQLPLPDAVAGELVRYLVAHEIGKAIGLRHNFKASSTYTIAQVRNPAWVKANGHSPSIMDDARFNYVAQPEDGIDPVDLIPKIGAYDRWAVRWGYSPIPSAKTPDQEKTTLDAWAREQDANPHLRFSTDEGPTSTDPGNNPDAVGDANAVMATTLGLKNLGRVSDMLLKATSTKTGDPWDDLEGDARFRECLALLASSAEDEGIAALQADHALPRAALLDKHGVNALLRERVGGGLLADVDRFHAWPAVGQELRIGQVVVDHHIGGGQ